MRSAWWTKWVAIAGLVLACPPACEKSADDGKAADKAGGAEKKRPKTCAWDEDCEDPAFVCETGRCQRGTRTPEQKAAVQKIRDRLKAEADAKAEAERPPGPDEGRLWIRVCPFFKKTPAAVAEITATNKATGKVYSLKLEDLLHYNDVRSEFAFPKVPIGDYDVVADYGIREGAGRQMVRLECDKKAKPCREKTIREIKVVPIADEPPPKVDAEGKTEKRPCDWIAQ